MMTFITDQYLHLTDSHFVKTLKTLPYSKKFNSIPISKSIIEKELTILCLQHIYKAYVILILNFNYRHLCVLY